MKRRSHLQKVLTIPLIAASLFCATAASAQLVPTILAKRSTDRLASLVGGPFSLNGQASGTMMAGLSELKAERVKGINSDARDNNPIISADGSLIFFNSTRRGDRAWARFSPTWNRYDDDIYYATRSVVRLDDEVWNEPINLGSEVNSSEDDGVAAISPDGQRVYFSSLKNGWEADGGPFYNARLSGTTWTSIEGLGGGITEFFRTRDRSARFRIYGAAISPDGREFYFATTVHSTSGNHQIWVARKNDQGQFEYPQNLGPMINSMEGTYAPFLASDGKTLFFSSRRKGGLGGDDVYVSVLTDGEWGEPINIGLPLNTDGDDAFLSVPASGDRAYIASARNGIHDDIYRAPLPDVLRPSQVVLLSGLVIDSETGSPVEANVTIEDLQAGQTIFNANSNSASGRYTVVLQPGRDYGISVTANGYSFFSKRYTIPENTRYEEYTQDFTLERLKEGSSFTVNNIFFAYNVDTVNNESRLELDRLIELLADRPTMRIEVGGHTDNIGSYSYNTGLSQRRADAVKQYLVEYGAIEEHRVHTKGYGFEKPAASNDTDEGRRKNRRTEFTILEM